MTALYLHSVYLSTTILIYLIVQSLKVFISFLQVNSHPLFAESNARHRAVSLMRTRKLFTVIAIGTIITVLSWTAITFIGDSTRKIRDPANANETIRIVVPKLMLPSWYPWDSREGMGYVFTFVYQVSFILIIIIILRIVHIKIITAKSLRTLRLINQTIVNVRSVLSSYIALSQKCHAVAIVKSITISDFQIHNRFS